MSAPHEPDAWDFGFERQRCGAIRGVRTRRASLPEFGAERGNHNALGTAILRACQKHKKDSIYREGGPHQDASCRLNQKPAPLPAVDSAPKLLQRARLQA